MAKLSKDEWISLFNKFINESDSYGEAIGKVQQYIVDNYSFSIEKKANRREAVRRTKRTSGSFCWHREQRSYQADSRTGWLGGHHLLHGEKTCPEAEREIFR